MAQAGHIAIGVLTLLIWIFGYIPFICFHLLRFYNFRRDITLSKRYPQITLITVISLLVWIIVFILEIIRYFFNGPIILEEIFDFINIIINFIFACSILWRCWLSYYDIKFSIASSSREWQQFIREEYKFHFDNWYFKKRKTYGDYTWTKKRFTIGTSILIILFILISFPDWLAPLRFLFILIPWICILFIYYKTPSFYDEFSIRLEMKHIIILYSSVFIAYLILIVIIFVIIQSSNNMSEAISAVFVGIAFNFLALILFLIARIMTYWVLKTVDVGFDEHGDPLRAPLNPWAYRQRRSHTQKISQSGFDSYDQKNTSHTSRDRHESSEQQFSTTSTAPNSSKMGPKEKILHISLSTMFSDIKYINEFFGHLSREFSMECLLAMIEFIQLQQYILLHMQQYKNFYYKQFSNLKIKNNVELPRGIPRSTIIYGDNEELVDKYLNNVNGRIISIMEREQVRVRLISYQLYKKYAAIGSEWEINISYETRGRLTAKLHNFNEWMSTNKSNVQMWQLVQLFEDSKHEMYRLLRHSFARFKRSDDFEKIRNYHQKKLDEIRKKEEEQKPKIPPKGDVYIALENEAQHEIKPSLIEEEHIIANNDDLIHELKQPMPDDD